MPRPKGAKNKVQKVRKITKGVSIICAPWEAEKMKENARVSGAKSFSRFVVDRCVN